MKIDADLFGGAIHVLDATSPSAAMLQLRADNASDFMQWFHFRVTEADGADLTFNIVNAGESTYPGGWDEYRAAASYDGARWFRVDTELDDEGTLSIRHTPEQPTCLYAYFAAYSWDRHLEMVEGAKGRPGVHVDVLGQSVEHRPMHRIRIGEAGPDKRQVWILARQHPGETMGQWFMEGVLERLLDADDADARAVLEGAVFHLVPLMNPDGAAHGNQRTNAAGRNLNREWLSPSHKESPEVFAVRKAMIASGVDLFLDVHGDEDTPYVFAAGCEGNPGYSPRIDALEDLFMRSLMELDEDFQRRYGYDLDEPGEADLSVAANYAGERFDCLALTLEMPFKDAANHPDPEKGWSPERAAGFGAHVIGSILACLPELR
jgi:murein tripeptide amidase MpaA